MIPTWTYMLIFPTICSYVESAREWTYSKVNRRHRRKGYTDKQTQCWKQSGTSSRVMTTTLELYHLSLWGGNLSYEDIIYWIYCNLDWFALVQQWCTFELKWNTYFSSKLAFCYKKYSKWRQHECGEEKLHRQFCIVIHVCCL